MGTFAVVSIMVGKVVTKYATNPDNVLAGANSINGTVDGALQSDTVAYTPMDVVSSLCIVVAGFNVSVS